MANESSSSDGLGLQLGPLRPQRVGGAQANSNGSSSGSATAAMPSGAQALHRAIASVGRIDAALAQLVPISTVKFHGAGILAGLRGAAIPEAPEAEPQK